MADNIKRAETDFTIHDLLTSRWSPYVFSDKPVSDTDLRALFEAARWAPSSYNEQPWRYFIASKEDTDAYQKILSCLVEGNQAWAKHAPVLGIGMIMHNLAKTGKPNRAALHDLGAASLSLTIEAQYRGLHVHQMIGIEPDKVKKLFQLPDDAEAYTGLAIGYVGDADKAEEPYKTRDNSERTRKPIDEIVYFNDWGKAKFNV